MPFKIRRSMHTETAHVLNGHPGKCKFVHGHSYKWTVEFESVGLQDGMVCDFSHLSKKMHQALDRFDHATVLERGTVPEIANRIENAVFVDYRPTAENMCKHVYDTIKRTLQAEHTFGLRVSRVICRETENSEAEYYE